MAVRSNYYDKETIKKEICSLIDEHDPASFHVTKRADAGEVITIDVEVTLLFNPKQVATEDINITSWGDTHPRFIKSPK